ncbi:hypothetical protein H2199_008303 [Coniosporium tulheliwenetii]|uniref:Uncharacterized protein n=1 Tax=Coniosporium tulheliwenetii TaxID=3383036 RepID=A0ACC2YKX8_9PEZI|nr:hypothetical protein H2199_008303 [Cladosporium sp. JES 115]
MKVDGKSVGGYAWTYKGWFGTYQYITLCPPFFTLDTLEEKITFVEDALQRGELKYAEGAEWQKNSGQYFLHEMMHLDSIGIPHINDEKYDPREPSSAYAYGPRVVYKLAQRSLNQMGGAERASTNADSYAWLANIIYFWDLTNYFPKPPGFKVADLDDISSGGEDRAQDVFPIHLGEITAETSEEELQSRFQTALEGWKTAEPPAALPPANDISPPTAPQKPPAEASIDSFCNQRQYWDTVLVPSVSFGTGQTNDGRGKALGVSEVYNLEGTSDKLWLGVFFARDGCVGSTPFTLGQTDQEKLDHCKARFGTVLNGCHTDTMTGKKGGTLRDGCAVYTVTTRPNGEKPFEGWDANQGDFTCKETDTSAIGGPASPLHGTCTCWYSGYPGLIDTFKMPASKNCADVNRAELVNN